jgi:hypothetical protein
MTLVVGILILIIQIKKYIEGYDYKGDNPFGQAAYLQFTGLGILIIMIGLYFIF